MRRCAEVARPPHHKRRVVAHPPRGPLRRRPKQAHPHTELGLRGCQQRVVRPIEAPQRRPCTDLGRAALVKFDDSVKAEDRLPHRLYVQALRSGCLMCTWNVLDNSARNACGFAECVCISHKLLGQANSSSLRSFMCPMGAKIHTALATSAAGSLRSIHHGSKRSCISTQLPDTQT